MIREVWHNDCLDRLPEIKDESVDAIITDPPYPHIIRDYGKLTEKVWHELMDKVVEHAKRVLKPKGSAVFILQPNFFKVGSMRLWLWEFLLNTAKNWNLIQDVYWWNFTTLPTSHCHRKRGFCRSSVKYCCWFGSPDAYHNQDLVLWTESDSTKALKLEDRVLQKRPNGQRVVNGRIKQIVEERGGVTPFNLIPLANTDSSKSAGASGHGAGTPLRLCEWWVKYIVPPEGLVLDPFAGTSTVGVACKNLNKSYIGIEKEEKYYNISKANVSITTTPNSIE